ncbi:MAG: ABC transporter ATP-binding protein [Thermodesulfobacteriota bacterium]
MSFISANNVSKTYGAGEAAVAALTDMSLGIETGEFVSIMGESGAGKSTLLSVLGGMNTPTAGSYKVDGMDIYALRSEQRADFRREYLGFIFQSFHLISYLSVMENVMLPLVNTSRKQQEKQDMAMQALAWVGLTSKADRLASRISGGEMERAAVARAIVNKPPILLADEPTGNLDSRNSSEVMQLLRQLNADGATVIMVTHSAGCAGYANRQIEVRDGKIVSQ